MSELVNSLSFGHRLTPDGYFDTARTDEIMFAAAERIAELEKDRADEFADMAVDAKRYRWLRTNLHNDAMKLPPMIYMYDGDDASYGEPLTETLDAAIDAAIDAAMQGNHD